MRPRLPRFAALIAMTAAIAACGSSGAPSSAAHGAAQSDATSRCAANRAAGTITYLTGFQYQGDTGILDVLAAQAEGLYHAECLSVSVRPGSGDPGAASQLTAAGKAQLAEVGGASDAITVTANGIDVVAVATYGNVPSITLLTNPGITDLRQLQGKTLGYKGAMPPEITAMLQKARVDVSKIHEVGVGYDPTILPRGQVAALTAYKSNEPIQLRDDHFTVKEWDPDQFGIKGTFNTLIANKAFVRAHPTAVEDFLRATFRAYQGCVANPQPCVAAAAHAQGSGYDSAQNTQEWQAQTAEVARSQPPGTGLGWQAVSQWQPEATLLLQDRLIRNAVNLSAVIDTAQVAAIEDHGQLVWPGPAAGG